MANVSTLRLLAGCCIAFTCCLPALADEFDIAGTSWFNEGTEFPSMCMTFEPNGTLRFKGGFLYYNPSRWSRVKGDPELIHIRLGGKKAFPTEFAKYQLEHRPGGGLVSFNARKRLLVYQIDFGNIPIDFGGFIFYRQERCDDV